MVDMQSVSNEVQTDKIKGLGMFDDLNTEVGQIIVARVGTERIPSLLDPDRKELRRLITRS